jgi:TRAP-type uncharacterized transport system substrate-binding protein
MRTLRSIFFFSAVALVAACEKNPTELVMVTPASPIDSAIARDIVALLGDEAEVTISLTDSGLSSESALDALVSGEADLALVPNNMPFRSGVSTVTPMYPTVLHIGYIGEQEFETNIDLFQDAKIFAGPEGSASRMMFSQYAGRMNLTSTNFSYVEGPEERPDVFVIFAPISPDRLADVSGITLVSSGTTEDIGTGSAIDAATLLNPQLKPFVIPVGTYGDATPTPIVTVAVDMMLVARNDLSASVIYDLVRELSRLRPALASQRPGLFQRVQDDFNAGNSTFVLHPGLVAYLDRNEPTIYERYSGVAEVAVTVIVALFSAIFAGVRIFHMRRKNRIDTFYTDVIAIRSALGDSSSKDEQAAAVQKIKALQNTAFELLVDEKLSADESFRIFISLSNDALRELSATDS